MRPAHRRQGAPAVRGHGSAFPVPATGRAPDEDRSIGHRTSAKAIRSEVGASLERSIGLWHLIAIGLDAIIGEGIFALAGPVATVDVGSAVSLSFLLAGFASACALAFDGPVGASAEVQTD